MPSASSAAAVFLCATASGSESTEGRGIERTAPDSSWARDSGFAHAKRSGPWAAVMTTVNCGADGGGYSATSSHHQAGWPPAW
jgi:hypothetical protein